MRMSKGLNEREQRFVDAYIGEAAGNATKAAELAGYSPKTARQLGSRLLTKVDIRDAVQARQTKRAEQADIDAVRVLKELARVGLSDVRKLFMADGSIKPIAQWDDETAAAVAGIDVVEMAGGAKIGGPEGVQHVPMYTKKLKLWDKVSALEKVAKHLGMFEEKHVHSGTLEVVWGDDGSR